MGVARRLLLKNASEESSWVYLNKQAAYMKIVNICEDESESPLGPLKMTFKCRDPLKLIDWIAPERSE